MDLEGADSVAAEDDLLGDTAGDDPPALQRIAERLMRSPNVVRELHDVLRELEDEAREVTQRQLRMREEPASASGGGGGSTQGSPQVLDPAQSSTLPAPSLLKTAGMLAIVTGLAVLSFMRYRRRQETGI